MWNGILRLPVRLSMKRPELLRAFRQYSVIHTPTVERVEVTCGSSGHISLSIHNSSKPSASQPLIICLLDLSPKDPTKQPKVPQSLLPNTLIQITPRWSPTHRFPTPIHDTLHAYTWILENIIGTTHSPYDQPRPIAIYGSGLGGTLATSLALTESRPASAPSQGSYIATLLVRDAIFDWSGIASTPPPLPPLPSPSPSPAHSHLQSQPKPQPASQDPDLFRLYELREKLFPSPASAFDAFASPLLFFRTTGLAVPSSFPSSSSSLPSTERSGEQESAAYATRKSHLTFPPKRSGLRIPWTRIAVTLRPGEGGGKVTGKKKGEGGGGVLRAQAEEMVKLMRRSVILHEGKERGRDEGFDGVWEAERRVALVDVEAVKTGGDVDDGEWAAEFLAEGLGVV